MQWLEDLKDSRFRSLAKPVRTRNDAPPHLDLPAVTPLFAPYDVRMRNASEVRQSWASYITALRRTTGVSRAELARRLDVDPTTIWRWETAKQKPESTAIPEALAQLFRLDLDEVLSAAGFRPDQELPAEPTTERDPEIEAILNSGLPGRIQKELIEFVEHEREQDEQRRLERLRRSIRLAGGKVA